MFGWAVQQSGRATEIGKVIEAQRSYSYALKMMITADEVETTVNNLANG